VQELSVTSGGISFAIRLIPKGGTIWIADAHRDDGKRKNEGSIPLTCFFIAIILSKIAQVNVLWYSLKGSYPNLRYRILSASNFSEGLLRCPLWCVIETGFDFLYRLAYL
jgi:hypothetical protein